MHSKDNTSRKGSFFLYVNESSCTIFLHFTKRIFEKSVIVYILLLCDTPIKNSETTASGIIAVISHRQKNFSRNSHKKQMTRNSQKKYLTNSAFSSMRKNSSKATFVFF